MRRPSTGSLALAMRSLTRWAAASVIVMGAGSFMIRSCVSLSIAISGDCQGCSIDVERQLGVLGHAVLGPGRLPHEMDFHLADTGHCGDRFGHPAGHLAG